ncbi:hypothetical protein A9Q84_18670 [Halobacteriovorax marinus]|uniref:Outer membrane protein beta-barrel domain-containing protein n=1 Tax=Halobacteriovorax marinus TaxID=97084 RepID=A0A1Y5F7X7_9BACT|nr:hypothetical protein A9Q84_18670 [Halobacteriovorax marinus]
MKKIKFISLITITLLSSNAWSLGTGISSYPLMTGKKLVTSELFGITSTGGGLGLQVRYTQKLSKKATLDGGIAISGGDRTSNFFAGVDYEIYPDYLRQPKISIKSTIEMGKENEVSRTKLSLAPTISKGFSFWGKEAFPFFSMPVGISLDSESKTYESTISANLGINGNLPIDGYNHLQGSAEVQFGVKDSYTSVMLGVSYPL